jgi:CubicO group peptidase (beta-lactamase class C family)
VERYARGYNENSSGSSRSMAKTFLGTLVGVAVRDGRIRSLDDTVGQYVPELAPTMYGKVSVRDLLTMTSGVPYRENPNDPTSDLFPLQACTVKGEPGCLLRFVKDLGSRQATPAQPGTAFNYSSADSVVEAILLERAIGKSAAQYLSEKIWIPFGMEQDGYWNVEAPGSVVVGPSGVGATLRDYGRFGLYLMRAGVLPDGTRTLPDDWFAQALQPTAASVNAKRPYGFNVWLPNGSMPGPATFFGQGSSGQVLMVDPAKRLVIVKWAAWDNGPAQRAMREEDWSLFKAIAATVRD